jgi:hypothetical protein
MYKREPGFYWVKHHFKQEWVIAEWFAEKPYEDALYWGLSHDDRYYCDSEFDEIDERRIVREYPGLTEDEKANIAEYVKSRSTAKGILDL